MEGGAPSRCEAVVDTLRAVSYTHLDVYKRQYLYRATLSQDLGNWVDSHVAALEYFQGAPRLVVPDNPRTGVDRACRYEPDLNRTYQEMAALYSVAVMPARPRKPRDKAYVSYCTLSGVCHVESWRLGLPASLALENSVLVQRFV